MKKVFTLLIIIGLLLFLGTAGASDCNTIDGSQIILQVSIAAFMIGGGYIGLQIADKKKYASGTTNTESAHKNKNLQLHCSIEKKGCQQYATTKTYSN